MAEVYRAYHPSLDRFVAIKILHTYLAEDPEFKTRFEKEAQSVARLKHPNIVQVYDFDYDPDGDSYYMVMELVDGPTVKELLIELAKNDARLPVGETLRIIMEAASALAYAHSQNMIHRDVKPANLILDKGKRVVLTDFGIAKMLTGQQHTTTGGMVGTPAYMAPEQGMGGSGDERADLYSLGVIFFELLTGRLPFEADTPVAMIMKHVNDPVPSVLDFVPGLPKALDEIIRRLLEKKPEQRYQTVAQLIADFKRLRSSRGPSAELAVSQTIPIRDKLAAAAPVMTTPARPAAPDDDDVETVIVTPKPGRRTGPPPEVIESGSQALPRKAIPWWWWALSVLGIIVAGAGGFLLSDSQRSLLAAAGPTETPTLTLTPTVEPSATLTPTSTPSRTPSPTETATSSATPSATWTATPAHTATSTRMPSPSATSTATTTPTPEDTPIPSATSNLTATAAFGRTATAAACTFDYAVVEQTPADGEAGGFYRVNEAYERKITLLNTGSCAWEANTSLTFLDGQNFNIGPRVFIRETVQPAATVTITIVGRLPARGSQTPLTGRWELRTPGQIPIGEPLVISILVYDPGT